MMNGNPLFVCAIFVQQNKMKMKRQLLLAILWISSIFFATAPLDLRAVSAATYEKTTGLPHMTVGDFISMDLKLLRNADGRRLGFPKMTGAKIMQKSLAKQVRKGKISADADLKESMAASANKRGLLSVIFSAAGLIFLFIPYVNILGLGFSIAGFVLGIIGIKRDADPTLAIIGTVLGGVALFIYLIAVIVVATWLSWF
jgi:hypothetical protein